LRWIVGFLLISASLLKAIDLLGDSTAASTLGSTGRLLLPMQIGVELALGLVVLNGTSWYRLRWLIVFLFAGFAAYSLYLALIGAASCACFGPLKIHPWWTFSLDVAVIIGILATSRKVNVGSERQLNPHYVIASATAIALFATVLLVRTLDHRRFAAEASAGQTGIEVLEPESWIDQKLPIAENIEADVDVSQGDWTLLFHRHDCHVCHETLPQYVERAAAGERVALIEVPPFGEVDLPDGGPHRGRLKDDRDWFVQTPVEVRLHDGVVTAVKAYEH